MTAAARRAELPIRRTSVFLYEWQLDGLDAVNRETHVPVSVLIRQGVTKSLAEHGIRPPASPARRARR